MPRTKVEAASPARSTSGRRPEPVPRGPEPEPLRERVHRSLLNGSPPPPSVPAAGTVLQLQRGFGNRYVQRLLRAGAPAAPVVQRCCPQCEEEGCDGKLHRQPAQGVLRREPKKPRIVDDPPAAALTVTLEGLFLEPMQGSVYEAGPKRPQLMAIALRRLLGGQYRPELVGRANALLDGLGLRGYGDWASSATATEGEKIKTKPRSNALARGAVVPLIQFLEKEKLQVDLTPEQRELLALGGVTADAWARITREAALYDMPLPAWYTEAIFFREMAQQGALLREYQAAAAQGEKDQASADRLTVATRTILDAVAGPANVLEEIRKDVRLAGEEKTKPIYGGLWKVTPAADGSVAVPTQLASVDQAVLFLGYLRTQAKLADEALSDSAQRAELLERFGRFVLGATLRDGPPGQEALRDRPAKANRPPLPASLSVFPPLNPPLFDSALGTDHRFIMEVRYSNLAEAFGRFAYSWERIRIPNERIGSPLDVGQLAGETPTYGEVASVRFDRATRYAEADVKKVLTEVSADLGPEGNGALDLVGANAILRYLGTGIHLGVELFAKMANEKHIVFPSTGLYMVRAILTPVLEGEEEVVRAPSVAYYPVLVRDPDEIASTGVASSVAARQATEKRLEEIERELALPGGSAEERRKLAEERDLLKTSLGPIGGALERRRAELAKRIEAIKAGKDLGDLKAAEKEAEYLGKVVDLRDKRKLAGAESPPARFVSDLGSNLPLSLEVADKPKRGEKFHVFVSDLTTPKSGVADGYGASREAAILDGVKQLLEGSHGYGRGRVSIHLGGTTHTLRIEASLGNLLSESIESVSMVLSIAAVAAAPFTGGASLSLLIPLGIAGAVPSSYRIAQRVEAGTFQLDFENAMDVVNIAGSVIGVGRAAAGSLRMVRLGKALMIVGFGADALGGVLLGADLVIKIEALKGLPEGERAAALLLIIGQAMITAGIIVGGSLAEQAQTMKAEAALENLGKGRAPGVPVDPARLPEPGAKPAATPREPAPHAGPEPLNRPPEEAAPRPKEAEPAPRPVAETVDEAFRKAAVEREVDQLGGNPETQEMLRKDDTLRKSLVENPLAASALKKCSSPCFPKEATPAQIKRLERLLERLKDSGAYDETALKKYLHDRRDNLDAAITQIEGTKRAADLNSWLDFYNKRGEGDVKKLPPKEDPRILFEQAKRAHDFGVKYGQAQANADGLAGVGFDNPIKQGAFGQGFDDVMKKGPNLDTGEVFIVEYKGGDAQLASGQMELDWVVGNIRRLYVEGGPSGQAWARVLAKALREGRLKGVAYSTPVAHGSPQTTVKIGAWDYGKVKLFL